MNEILHLYNSVSQLRSFARRVSQLHSLHRTFTLQSLNKFRDRKDSTPTDWTVNSSPLRGELLRSLAALKDSSNYQGDKINYPFSIRKRTGELLILYFFPGLAFLALSNFWPRPIWPEGGKVASIALFQELAAWQESDLPYSGTGTKKEGRRLRQDSFPGEPIFLIF